VPSLLALYVFTGLAVAIISIFVHVGVIKIGFEVVDGKKARADELLTHGALFWKFLAVSAVSCAVVFVTFIVPLLIAFFLALTFHNNSALLIGFLALIPASYLFLVFCYVPIVAVDRKLSLKETFKEGFAITKNNRWSLLGFFVVLVIINILGAIPAGIGLLVTAPVTTLAYLNLYRKLS